MTLHMHRSFPSLHQCRALTHTRVPCPRPHRVHASRCGHRFTPFPLLTSVTLSPSGTTLISELWRHSWSLGPKDHQASRIVDGADDCPRQERNASRWGKRASNGICELMSLSSRHEGARSCPSPSRFGCFHRRKQKGRGRRCSHWRQMVAL